MSLATQNYLFVYLFTFVYVFCLEILVLFVLNLDAFLFAIIGVCVVQEVHVDIRRQLWDPF